jgi:hypothetical protein
MLQFFTFRITQISSPLNRLSCRLVGGLWHRIGAAAVLFACFCQLFWAEPVYAEVPVQIDLRWGGAITYIGLDGQNVVDTNDCGRLIQLALYDPDLPRVIAGPVCLPSNPGYNVAWNPVQACDACTAPNDHYSPILAGSDKSYIKVRPLLWIGNGQPGDFLIEQRISQTQFPNAAKMSYKIIHEGGDYHKNLSVEFPATWIQGRYSKFVYYNGHHPWTDGAVSMRTTPMDYSTEPLLGVESWGALVDPTTDRGVGVYNPHSQALMNFDNDPAHGSNHPTYFTTWISYEVPPYSEFSLEFYILTGNWREMRTTIYQLPRNTNYLAELVAPVQSVVRRGDTINISVRVTNKTLVTFHKDPGQPLYDRAYLTAERKRFDGGSIGSSDWMSLPSDVLPGQSITVNYPLRIPDETGKFVFKLNVLNRQWLVGAGFPTYDFVMDVVDSLPPTNTPPQGIPGDANGDGVVNGVDYVIWLGHFGSFTPGGVREGDFNGDGVVNGVDYVIWLSHLSI